MAAIKMNLRTQCETRPHGAKKTRSTDPAHNPRGVCAQAASTRRL